MITPSQTALKVYLTACEKANEPIRLQYVKYLKVAIARELKVLEKSK